MAADTSALQESPRMLRADHGVNRPVRAATSPLPVEEKEALHGIRTRRAQTDPMTLPQFAQYTQPSVSPLVTPGDSIIKTLTYGDEQNLSQERPPSRTEAPAKKVVRSMVPPKAYKFLSDTGHSVLRFIETYWILCSLFFILSIVGISFAVGFALRLRTFDAAQVLDDEIANRFPAVLLGANLITIDPDQQTMTLDWFVTYNCHSDDCPDVNIYFDQNLLRSSSAPSSIANNAKPPPIFFINGTDSLNYNSAFLTNSPEFRTQVAITNYYLGGRSEQSYPFDKYSATLVFFAENISNNNSIPIAIDITEGIAVGFNAALDTSTSGNATDGVLIKNLEVTRGQVVRIYAILIVVAIWLVTLCFIMTCLVVVVFGKGVKPDILVVPVATLFAFTSLRSTMPGAPSGFGADIDFVGILPCLALLTLSSVLLSAIFLFRRDPEEDKLRWTNMMRTLRGEVPFTVEEDKARRHGGGCHCA